MSEFEKKSVEMELKSFMTKNFEKPAECHNLDQIRFHITELCHIIEEYESRLNYVPNGAYTLLAQYNAKQNSLLYRDFINTY